MLATFEARVCHGLLEPLEQVDLPEGKKLKVTVTDEAEIQSENIADTSKSSDPWESDPFFQLIGIMKSSKGDLSENHDKYIYNLKQ